MQTLKGRQAGKSAPRIETLVAPEAMEELKNKFWVEVNSREYARAGLQCNWLPKEYRKRRAVYHYTLPLDYELLAG